MTPLAAAAGQLTGSQLETVLLPTSVFPAGFASATRGPITSGGSLTTGAATYDLAKISCATFIEHLGNTGFGETAMVTGSVVGTHQAYDELIYQFTTAAGATAFADGIRSLAGRCGSFTAQDNGSAGTFSLSAATGGALGGHPTLTLTETGTLRGEKITAITLLCASGVDVFGATSVGVTTGAPAVPARETIAYQLMQRQAAASVLG
jgi:hypothetical protein